MSAKRVLTGLAMLALLGACRQGSAITEADALAQLAVAGVQRPVLSIATDSSCPGLDYGRKFLGLLPSGAPVAGTVCPNGVAGGGVRLESVGNGPVNEGAHA